MIQADLIQAREAWYTAYFEGDIEQLRQMEADHFTITTDRGVQSKRSQIDAICSAKNHGNWFPEGGNRRETGVTIDATPNGYRITGHGVTVSGITEEPPVAFSESWEWTDGHWQVCQLSYRAS